ncbi:MAG: phytanoyl-CoA dioxygenase family protein [Moorea sp. SIO2B7]|nr:phytanoyl-CoA dioxygenase family protein [Moorena sp. SIO2B7]
MSNIHFISQIEDLNFWKNFNPELTISENWTQTCQLISVNSQELKQILQELIEEGYFQIDDFFPPADILKMSACVEKLQQEGLPVVFAFIYDEFWQIFYKLSPILKTILGDDYLQVPDVWAWYVAPSKEAKGWEPHRDRRKNSLLPNGMPKALNIWIPLTEVTPLNGCMYILPADLDPNYNQDTDTVGINPQDIRALPASAGSVLSWNPVVWHWGSRSSNKAKVPRISIACDFQRSDAQPYEELLLNPSTDLSFQQRLGLIGKLILRFRVRYQYADELLALAVKLQHHAPLPYWVVGSQYSVKSDHWNHVGIKQGSIVEMARWKDEQNIMVKHPDKQGIFYPFSPLELEHLLFT